MRVPKLIFCAFGWFFLLLCVIGVVLPGLPHTPFFLLSLACFAKGSEKIHAKILSIKYIGPSVRDWQEHRRIKKSAKVAAAVWIVLSISFSVFVVEKLALRIMLITIGAVVLAFIFSRKSK